MRASNRLSGPLSVLVWVSDDIRDAGGEEDWLPCSSLRCLGLLGGMWRAFVRFSRIIWFQMPEETSLMLASPSTVVVVGRLYIIHGICALVEILSLSKDNSILSFLHFYQNHNSPFPKPQNAFLS